ncbi:myeloid differentiation primary response protein MyD88-like [Patiria miniata]|uniref:Myeloid differentiation primary response protein MyD88 n=1 Tax=Patiria miniata TaxID=46514 RepID=A0A914BRI1_PATMI|nr:myeloid differentiation primary response protein MyD88-like [Patiria miniata]
MSESTFSTKCDREATACLYPGQGLGGNQSDNGTGTAGGSQVVASVDSGTHKTDGRELTATLCRTEPTACLFPHSGSDSQSNEPGSLGAVSATCATTSRTTTTMSSSIGDGYSPHVYRHTMCGLQVEMPSYGSSNNECELEKVPAKALNVPTRTRLSLMLNPPKVLHNDWTGLAGEMGFEYEEIENFALEKDPMKIVLSAWTCRPDSTIGALLEMLSTINRDDVLNDIRKLVERDASRWVERRKGDVNGQPVQVPEVSESYPNVPETPELRGITLEDHPSGPPEVFDAYVCFTYADSEFVKEMMAVLEKEPYNLKLCIDFRDLVPGGSYSTITAELIENRCKRMIIVLSPDFLTSEDCNFQTKFAHSIAPSARSKRLIPVMVENCKLPNILRHLTICDYTKKDLRQWFWPRLHGALTKK